MPEVPDDSKQYINSEFARRLEEIDPPKVNILVETEDNRAQEISEAVTGFDGASLGRTGIINGKYFPATVPQETIPDVARLDGVVKVHQDQPAGVMGLRRRVRQLPVPTTEDDPLLTAASDFLYNTLGPKDDFVPNVRIGTTEVPRVNFTQVPPGNPVQIAQTFVSENSDTNLTGEEIIPTEEAVAWIRDDGLTDEMVADDTKVAVIDTGHSPTEPTNGGRTPKLESWVPGEPPLDMMGHGSWCTNMAVGNSAPGAWGRTAGVAPESAYGHFKALNTFPGFGRTSWILKSMDRAVEWGADVISMSLGGTQQGPVDEDPYARFINENCKENLGVEEGAIFVVAAGNSGPGRFTIGSPGVAPKALTVGSWSLTDGAPAVFSSRGPQGSHYDGKPDELESDIAEFGADEVVKPDVAAPGGGRRSDEKSVEKGELLFQTSVGWYDGLKDGLKDGRASMKGTSMATPAVAGLVKRLYDGGVIDTAAEVKQVVNDRAPVEEYPRAAPGANETRNGKNVSVGFGPIRESLFSP